MAKVIAIAVTELRRTFRLRINIFLIFVFPMLLILVLGVTFGGFSTPQVGVVSADSGALGRQLLNKFESTPSISVVQISDSSSLQTEVARGDLAAGVVIPSGYDADLRNGRSAVVTYIARPDQTGQQVGQAIQSVVARQSETIGAAQFLVKEGAVATFEAGLAAADQASPRMQAVTVTVTNVGSGHVSSSGGQYAEGAWTELVLFIFLIALTGGATSLITQRRLGLSRRMMATPTTPSTLVAGEVLGLLFVSIVQAVVIIGGSALVFGVRWGDPVGVTAVVAVFALVSVGAGRLIGTLLGNEQQAIPVTLLAGLGLAALGGCMAPLEIFSPTMKQVAHLTPQAWANDAFAQLVGHGATVVQILPQLGVLAAFAAVLLTLATWRLRAVLTA